METKEIIVRVKDLLADPEHWTQKQYASTAAGERVAAGDMPEAVRWCLMGAVEKVCGTGNSSDPLDKSNALKALQDSLPGLKKSLEDFNDTNTHEDIIGLIDRCLASL